MRALALLCLVAGVAAAEPRVEIVELAAQPIVYKTVKVPPAKLEAELQTAFLAVLGLATRNGLDIAGPPVARYRARGENYVVDAALPVRTAPGAIKGLRSGTLPAGPAATLAHTGALAELPRTHAALDAWLTANKRKAAGPRWELFIAPTKPIDTPHRPAAALRTPAEPGFAIVKVIVPLAPP